MTRSNRSPIAPLLRPAAVTLLSVVAGHAAHADATARSVAMTYADIATAGYAESLNSARILRAAIDVLVVTPDARSLGAARDAWRAARAPYRQTEVFRFGTSLVDEREGRVNIWPLNGALIDDVDVSRRSVSHERGRYAANSVAGDPLTIGGRRIDATTIAPAPIGNALHEAGGIESSVATGYQVIEFLLWGQELDDRVAGAGERARTNAAAGDDDIHAHSERRAAYLVAAADLLVTCLDYMRTTWAIGGAARESILGDKGAIGRMLTGMSSPSGGEPAGERAAPSMHAVSWHDGEMVVSGERVLAKPREQHDALSRFLDSL